MSDEKEKKPARVLTIRIGDELVSDIKDFILLVRDSEDSLSTRATNSHWAHGAMSQAITEIEHRNYEAAGHECGEDCEGDDDDDDAK